MYTHIYMQRERERGGGLPLPHRGAESAPQAGTRTPRQRPGWGCQKSILLQDSQKSISPQGTTPGPCTGLPKVNSPSRQEFSRGKHAQESAPKPLYPLQQSGVAPCAVSVPRQVINGKFKRNDSC